MRFIRRLLKYYLYVYSGRVNILVNARSPISNDVYLTKSNRSTKSAILNK